MKLTYLGTAAAEGFPGIFCDCSFCRRARTLGGRNLRSRAQSLIDDSLLIDFSPDTLYHVYRFGLRLHEIRDLIVTHSHPDHFYAHDLTQRRPSYAHFEGEAFPLHIYGSRPTLDKALAEITATSPNDGSRWEFTEWRPYEPVAIGKYTVTPLKAAHGTHTVPYIFDITDGEKRLLYAHDSGIFPEETWRYFSEKAPYYHLISLDSTTTFGKDHDCHMTFSQNIQVRDRLLTLCADADTRFVLNHFSHNGGAVYEDFCPIAGKEGFLVSYDGMSMEI